MISTAPQSRSTRQLYRDYLTHLSLTHTLKQAMMWSAAFSNISPGFRDMPTNDPEVSRDSTYIVRSGRGIV